MNEEGRVEKGEEGGRKIDSMMRTRRPCSGPAPTQTELRHAADLTPFQLHRCASTVTGIAVGS
eukprot:1152392-Pyramimonas_sp.AAC.1